MPGFSYENGHLGQTLDIGCYWNHMLASLWSHRQPLVAAQNVFFLNKSERPPRTLQTDILRRRLINYRPDSLKNRVLDREKALRFNKNAIRGL